MHPSHDPDTPVPGTQVPDSNDPDTNDDDANDDPENTPDPSLEAEFAALSLAQAQAKKALDAATAESRAASVGGSGGGKMADRAAEHLRLADKQITAARDKFREFRATHPEFAARAA